MREPKNPQEHAGAEPTPETPPTPQPSTRPPTRGFRTQGYEPHPQAGHGQFVGAATHHASRQQAPEGVQAAPELQRMFGGGITLTIALQVASFVAQQAEPYFMAFLQHMLDLRKEYHGGGELPDVNEGGGIG